MISGFKSGQKWLQADDHDETRKLDQTKKLQSSKLYIMTSGFTLRVHMYSKDKCSYHVTF